MSGALQKPKLLIVDTDTAMAEVLKTYVKKNHYESDIFSDSADACAALTEQTVHPDIAAIYDCVILGWPKGEVRIISDFLNALCSEEHSDLPLIILSEEPDPGLQTLSRRRSKTQTMLWSEYTRIESVLSSILANNRKSRASLGLKKNPVIAQTSQQESQRLPTSVLLVDDTPTVCHALRDMLESNGYFVSLASTAGEARSALAKNNFDLVLTEFFLSENFGARNSGNENSGEGLCRYLQSLNLNKRPVYAVMARKNLQSTVQKSLAIGAIACLDKSESIELLYARLNAIATGLSSRRAASTPVEHHQAGVASVADILQSVKMPSLLIGEQRNILAANDAATTLLSDGSMDKLQNKSFEESIHGAPLRRSIDMPVKALFKTLDGRSLSVAYRCREVDVSEYGISEIVSMLTFEAVNQISTDQKAVGAIKAQGDSTETIRKPVAAVSNITQADVGQSGVVSIPGKPDGKTEKPIATTTTTETVRTKIEKVLQGDESSFTYSLLTLDIKMVASVTGDRLSIRHSKPMLELVEAELKKHCAQQASLEYIGDGRFVVLYKNDGAEQSRLKASKLVDKIPGLISELTDVRLLSHASFIELPAGLGVSVDYVLKHSTAACLKTEVDGRDNLIFHIDTIEKPTVRKSAMSRRKRAGSGTIEVSASSMKQQLENQPEMQAS